MAFETIIVDKHDNVGLITINRPKALNALNDQVIAEIDDALSAFDLDQDIGAIVLTGSERSFAAGADIKEMAARDFAEAKRSDFIASWQSIATHKKPVIAAVAGYALGGGCELALMCDMIIAADNAKFGQPEITLGTIPGAGATQRLTLAIGKSKAMEMILTGRNMDAVEAERSNLVCKVVPLAELLETSLAVGKKIASNSKFVVAMAKEAVNVAYETNLQQGILFERNSFYASFATEDRKEGMNAFIEKRTANFKDC